MCVCVCVCVCVSVAMLSSTWYVYMSKVRYHQILHELYSSFDSWILLCLRDIALFAYLNNPQHFLLPTNSSGQD